LPALTNSDVPEDLRGLFYQLSRWFLGPSRFLAYLGYAKNRFPEFRKRLRNWGLVLFCLYDTLSWLLTSPITLSIFACWCYGIALMFTDSLDIHYSLLLMSCALFVGLYMLSIAVVLQDYPLLISLAVPEQKKKKISAMRRLHILLIYPLLLLFHSIPAYHCIYDIMFKKGRIRFTKTERR